MRFGKSSDVGGNFGEGGLMSCILTRLRLYPFVNRRESDCECWNESAERLASIIVKKETMRSDKLVWIRILPRRLVPRSFVRSTRWSAILCDCIWRRDDVVEVGLEFALGRIRVPSVLDLLYPRLDRLCIRGGRRIRISEFWQSRLLQRSGLRAEEGGRRAWRKEGSGGGGLGLAKERLLSGGRLLCEKRGSCCLAAEEGRLLRRGGSGSE